MMLGAADAVVDRLRARVPTRRFSSRSAPAPEARPHEGESLADRYRRMAQESYQPHPADAVVRALDVVIAGTALCVLVPRAAAVAVAVRLDSEGPALDRGLRVGRAGSLFTMFKFRTLTTDAEQRLGPYLGETLDTHDRRRGDARRALSSATHLDELPQLLNVLAGDMSLVGPRPIRPAFFEELCEEIPQYWQRLVVAPGMTGFAQLRITREDTWADKLGHDLEYIADRSVALYLSTILETARDIPRRARAG